MTSLSDPNPANRRRSERVMLRVPVMVRAKVPGGESLEEQTQTEIVNAHGCLVKLKMDLLVGQPVLLINLKSKMGQSGKVVRVEHGTAISAVAFEFDQPAPHFWPIEFPPADWGLKKP